MSTEPLPTLLCWPCKFSAHFVSRSLRALGHEPCIIPAMYVKPFVKGQKNDYNDAEAIAEAALRPNLHHASGRLPGIIASAVTAILREEMARKG